MTVRVAVMMRMRVPGMMRRVVMIPMGVVGVCGVSARVEVFVDAVVGMRRVLLSRDARPEKAT